MFKCNKCGLCCKIVSSNENYKYLDRGDGICVNFNCDTNLCSIYKIRPVICRVDEAYVQFFKESLTIEEYYSLNYKACELLKILEVKKMSDIKAALKEKFEEIFGYASGDDYTPRVNNAREIMCQGKYRKDDIIEIVDTSIMSNGKSGLVLTIDSVCVKDMANYTSRFIAKYEDIDYTYCDSDRKVLELNMKFNTKYEISISAISKRNLMDFIDYAMSLYQENDKLEW